MPNSDDMSDEEWQIYCDEQDEIRNAWIEAQEPESDDDEE